MCCKRLPLVCSKRNRQLLFATRCGPNSSTTSGLPSSASCADASRHASIIVQLASGLRTALRQEAALGDDVLARNAARAKLAETRADEIVKETRLTVRRIPGTEVFGRILEVADDAADDLEDLAFLAGLLSARATRLEPPAPLLALSDLLVEDAQAFQHAIGAAQYVHRGGPREHMQQFLEAVDHVARSSTRRMSGNARSPRLSSDRTSTTENFILLTASPVIWNWQPTLCSERA